MSTVERDTEGEHSTWAEFGLGIGAITMIAVIIVGMLGPQATQLLMLSVLICTFAAGGVFLGLLVMNQIGEWSDWGLTGEDHVDNSQGESTRLQLFHEECQHRDRQVRMYLTRMDRTSQTSGTENTTLSFSDQLDQSAEMTGSPAKGRRRHPRRRAA